MVKIKLKMLSVGEEKEKVDLCTLLVGSKKNNTFLLEKSLPISYEVKCTCLTTQNSSPGYLLKGNKNMLIQTPMCKY